MKNAEYYKTLLGLCKCLTGRSVVGSLPAYFSLKHTIHHMISCDTVGLEEVFTWHWAPDGMKITRLVLNVPIEFSVRARPLVKQVNATHSRHNAYLDLQIFCQSIVENTSQLEV
jgi:hypothetical protein